MHAVRITSTNNPHFNEVWKLYKSAFPAHEQRTEGQMEQALNDLRCHLEAWFDQEEFIGLLQWWKYPDFSYVENLAIVPEKRGGGQGQKILRTLMNPESASPVILEIDPLEDEVARRRWHFYAKLGYVMNAHRHLHPPYQPGDATFELCLLSWPSAISEAQYARFHQEHWHYIIPLPVSK